MCTNEDPRVLIVDDNYFNVVILKEIILQLNPRASIEEFFCPVKALERVKESVRDTNGTFNLVLTDINMPKMSGYELERSIREVLREATLTEGRCFNSKIVACSASENLMHEPEWDDSQFDDFLSKPVTKLQLEEAKII